MLLTWSRILTNCAQNTVSQGMTCGTSGVINAVYTLPFGKGQPLANSLAG